MQTRKINYYKKSLEEIDKVSALSHKPSLLLHACCGPCSCFPLVFLCSNFDVTIFFNNNNIYPETEYLRRYEELMKFLEFFKKDYGYEVKVIKTEYDNSKYNEELEPYKDAHEGGKRCLICYEKRMREAFDYAESHCFDYFTTVMTISRQKNSQILNEIGKKLENEHKFTKYFYSDFKKNKGIDIAREMRIHYDLYQQLYCGCKYTYEEGLQREKDKNK